MVKINRSNVVTTNGKANTGARITTQFIDKILKGLKFKSPKTIKKGIKIQSIIDHDLLYIQKQMPKTKTTPRKGRG